MRVKRKKPKIKVLDWPAIPVPTPEEVYGITTEEKARIEKELRETEKGRGKRDRLREEDTATTNRKN